MEGADDSHATGWRDTAAHPEGPRGPARGLPSRRRQGHRRGGGRTRRGRPGRTGPAAARRAAPTEGAADSTRPAGATPRPPGRGRGVQPGAAQGEPS